MKKQITIKDFTPRKIRGTKMEIISWDEIEMKLGKKEFKKFNKWMFGQTYAIQGVYIRDLERYLLGEDSYQYP